MASSKTSGDSGEEEVIELVPCPNCDKKLMKLPPSYPLYDVQCTGCSFRAQVKTNNCKPKNEILGAGWDVIDKVLKSGFMIPPLFANFRWSDKNGRHQKIYFYPFLPKTHLKKRTLSSTARRANYRMFNYIDLHQLHPFVVYDTDGSRS
jgi:hypothetical protein